MKGEAALGGVVCWKQKGTHAQMLASRGAALARGAPSLSPLHDDGVEGRAAGALPLDVVPQHLVPRVAQLQLLLQHLHVQMGRITMTGNFLMSRKEEG